jgi:hypothetical protein
LGGLTPKKKPTTRHHHQQSTAVYLRAGIEDTWSCASEKEMQVNGEAREVARYMIKHRNKDDI